MNLYTEMKIIAFIADYAVIDKIIHHLGVTFAAKRPPPPATRPRGNSWQDQDLR
jgi:hypothetical protein